MNDLAHQTEPRTLEQPPDVFAALIAAGLRKTFEAMGYSHRKEWARAIADAKRAETRAKRIRECVEALRSRSAR